MKEKKERIKRTKKDIERLQEFLDNPPEMEDLDEIQADIVSILLLEHRISSDSFIVDVFMWRDAGGGE